MNALGRRFAAPGKYSLVNELNQILRRYFWRPAGFVPALESLGESQGVASRRDVAAGPNHGEHRLQVVELAGGKIIGNVRLIATAANVVVGGLQSLYGCAQPQAEAVLHRRRFRMPKYRRGTALLLATATSTNYFHWLLECVPRWKILQAAEWLEYDFVLLHNEPSRFQDEVLDRLKVPPAKRLRCSKYLVHQFERLVVPVMPFPLWQVAPWACSWVRSLFPEQAPGPEKVYLRRGKCLRPLANEPELESALQPLGFVPVQPDQLTVAGQARLLSSARCAVAPHGAVLTNMIFAAPGAMLLELIHPQFKNGCYASLAAACGHRYACVDGRPVGRANRHRQEYAVDVSAVLEELERT